MEKTDANNIMAVLKEATDGLLTEESLKAIEVAFTQAVEQRTTLNVEAALVKQDGEYASKLKTLLEAIDNDRATKLKKVIGAVDSNNAAKLQKVVKKYKSALAKEAADFKKSLVGSISKYLEVYLEQAIPQNFINEAVLDRKAQTVLNNLRQHLAVDSSLMKESVRGAVIDGKRQLNEAQSELEKATQQVQTLEEEIDKLRANLVFVEKTQNLPAKKRDYVRRVLAGKTSEFISENIDYTINLFEKTETDHVDSLREQAMKDIVSNDDAPVINESNNSKSVASNSDINPYMSELSKY